MLGRLGRLNRQGRHTTGRRFPARRRLWAAALAPILAAVGISAGLVALPAGVSGASGCSPATSCALSGTATLTAGSLDLATGTSTLSWSTTLTGAALTAVDTTTSDQYVDVTDATGSGDGWKVTVAATTFTDGSDTLANTGTFSVNGSTSSATGSTAPSDTCANSTSCTLPTNDVSSYPVDVTTAASSPTAATIFDVAEHSGLGQVEIGAGGSGTGSDPIGWWLSIPADAIAGSYTSTVTLAVSSGP